MLLFAIKRLLYTVPVLFAVVTMLFGLMQATHRDPLRHAPPLGLESNTGETNPRYKRGDPKPPAITHNIKRKLGLDKPLYDQYLHYVGGLVRLDFGHTFTYQNQTVNDVIRQGGPVTLELVLLALAWAVALAIPLAVLAAARAGTVVDRVVTASTAVTLGLPSFFVGTVLLWLLAVKGGVVPTFGWAGFRAKLLPSFVLSLVPFALITRVLRAELLEIRGRDYVQVARGKGLRRARILLAHVLRPALIPITSMVGPLLGQLVTGMFVVEWIFAIPGIGRYFVAASQVGDYPLALGLTVLLTMVIVVANAAADVALGVLDPRTRTA
jgi:oligopeptide transport system permease protein